MSALDHIRTRRSLLKSISVAGAALALPSATLAAGLTKQERIQHHAQALLALVRDEFPDDATGVSVTVGKSWGPTGQPSEAPTVLAQGFKTTWNADARLKAGGVYSERSLGHWSPACGRF